LLEFFLLWRGFDLLRKNLWPGEHILDLLDMHPGCFISVELWLHVDAIVTTQVKLADVIVVTELSAVVHERVVGKEASVRVLSEELTHL